MVDGYDEPSRNAKGQKSGELLNKAMCDRIGKGVSKTFPARQLDVIRAYRTLR